MPKKNSKILAIDPSNRKMGVALLENRDLIYHGVKTIRKSKSPHETLKEARKTVLRLIKDFKPKVLVVEKAFFSNNRNASLLNVFVDEIRSIERRKKLKLFDYAPNTVKKYICGNGRAGKNDVAKVIAAKFPELRVYLTQDRAWKKKHHQNMFDAVALAVMASKK